LFGKETSERATIFFCNVVLCSTENCLGLGEDY
jgi:hypothetical protein